MFKKLLAGLSVIALSLGIVALTAGPASAYVKSIDASCTALNVSLSGYNGEADNTVTVYVDDAVAVDAAAFGESYGTSVPFPQDGNAHTYRVVVVAHDGADGGLDTGTVTVDPCVQENVQKQDDPPVEDSEQPGDPAPEAQTLTVDAPPVVDKVRICHATSSQSNPYTNPEVSVRSIINLPNGHHYHERDIIPPFYYLHDDEVKHYPGLNWNEQTQRFYDAECEEPRDREVRAEKPTFFDAYCTNEGELSEGGYIIPDAEHVKYLVRHGDSGPFEHVPDGTYYVEVGTHVQIKAVAHDGYTIKGDWKWSDHIDGPEGPCVEVVRKVLICHATSSESNPYTNPEVSVRSIINVPNGHHYHERDIIPPFYYLDDDEVKHYPGLNWNERTQRFWEAGCEKPKEHDARAHVKIIDATCYEPGSAEFFIKHASWRGEPSTEPGEHMIWAVAHEGYLFENGRDRIKITYMVPDVLDDSQCIVPEVPKFYDAYCDEQVPGGVVDGYFVVYATDGVYYTWKLNGADQGVVPEEAYGIPIPANVGDTVVIKAHAMDGYELKHPREARWMHEFTLDDLCTLPTVEVDVDWTQPTCDADGSLSFETVDGDFYPGAVEWTVDGLPATEGDYDIAGTRTVVLTATATEGYGFAGEEGSTLEWELDFTDPRPCDDLPTLALTGTDSSVLSGLGFGGVMLLAGGLLVLARQRRALIRP